MTPADLPRGDGDGMAARTGAAPRAAPGDRLHLRRGCVLVRGARNGAIYDLRRQEIHPLDAAMARALELAQTGLPVGDLLLRLEEEGHDRGVMEEVITFLRELPVVEDGPPLPAPSGGASAEPPRTGLDFIWLELTGRCNLQCVHCYAGAGGGPRTDELGRERWIAILEEAAALGCRKVQFTGGEPTTHPDLFPLLRRAKEIGYTSIEIFTNATLLTEEEIDLLGELEVRVAVSIYSHDPAIHDRVTGQEGSWDRTTRSIRLLLDRGVPLRVAVIVMRVNEETLEETIRYLRSLGIEEVGIDTIRPTGRGIDPGIAPLHWANEMTSPPTGATGCGEGLSFNSCWTGKAAIDSRGRVFPCIFSREEAAGEIGRGSLGEVVEGGKLRRFWDLTLDEVEVCRDCEFRFGCRDCRSFAQTAGGGLHGKTGRCTYDPYSGRWGRGSGRQVDDLRSRVEATGGVAGEEEMGSDSGRGRADRDRPRRRSDVLAREVDGEIVLFDPVTNGIHGLNPTASFVWDLCDGSMSPEEIARELASIYPEEEAVPRDVEETLEKFRSLRLLEG